MLDLLNVYRKLGSYTPEELDATIRYVSKGLADRGIRFAAYKEAMTRFCIGACGRTDKDRQFDPPAPVIVEAAYQIECTLRGEEYRQREAERAKVLELCTDRDESEPLTAEQQAKLDVIRARIRKSTKSIPKESTHGKS